MPGAVIPCFHRVVNVLLDHVISGEIKGLARGPVGQSPRDLRRLFDPSNHLPPRASIQKEADRFVGFKGAVIDNLDPTNGMRQAF